MSDLDALVAELRHHPIHHSDAHTVMCRAADAIENLRAELATSENGRGTPTTWMGAPDDDDQEIW